MSAEDMNLVFLFVIKKRNQLVSRWLTGPFPCTRFGNISWWGTTWSIRLNYETVFGEVEVFSPEKECFKVKPVSGSSVNRWQPMETWFKRWALMTGLLVVIIGVRVDRRLSDTLCVIHLWCLANGRPELRLLIETHVHYHQLLKWSFTR